MPRRATSRAAAANTSTALMVKGTSFQTNTTKVPVGGSAAVASAAGTHQRARTPRSRTAAQV
ncbi:hypothetical protein GCM10009663_23950 [Kitasatospora arboriphila]|uniref:Uncharacterized protein n=1 Tax=Kitasatospora arboriphila TaxID=258052 RepID=A0ABN1TFH7_9ACTN